MQKAERQAAISSPGVQGSAQGFGKRRKREPGMWTDFPSMAMSAKIPSFKLGID
jgi:hypothetical protein